MISSVLFDIFQIVWTQPFSVPEKGFYFKFSIGVIGIRTHDL